MVEPFGRGNEALKAAEIFDGRLKLDKKEGIKPAAKSQIYFDALAQSYLDDRRANGASTSYIDELKGLLNNHIFQLEPIKKKTVEQLTYQDMLEIADYYKDRAQPTRNRYFGYLRAIFRYGTRHGITKNNPLSGWSKKKETPRRTQLTVEDLEKIMEHAAPHLKWAIEVAFNLGARPGPSELLSLKWDQVNFDKGVVSIFATKTDEWRDIPISDGFRQSLLQKKAEAQTDHVIEYKGRPINKFRRSFRTACKEAGITYECIMYDVRHLFASVILQGGGDLAAVSKLMGHASTFHTANTYYEVMKGEKARAINLLPQLKKTEKEPSDKILPFHPKSPDVNKNVNNQMLTTKKG